MARWAPAGAIVVWVEVGSRLSDARSQVCMEDTMQSSLASAEHISSVVLSSDVKIDTLMTDQRNTRHAIFEQAYSQSPSLFF